MMEDPFAGVPAATEIGGAAYSVVPNTHAQPYVEHQPSYGAGFLMSAAAAGQTGAAISTPVTMKEAPVGPFLGPDTTGSKPGVEPPTKANRKQVLAKPGR